MKRVALAFALVAVAAAGCGELAEPATERPDAGRAAEAGRATGRAHAAPRPRAGRRPVATPAASGTAAAALMELPVKGRAPKTGYARERFGDGWLTTDGCSTRDRMLRRDLTDVVRLDGCRVQAGTLADPYTATSIRYERGGASEVDVDHVVALSDAWQKGAQRWTFARRVAFANDPLNLLAVDAAANRAKGDGDAATWLPPNTRFRCAYVARQVAVKRKYRLWVTPAERDAIGRVLARCPDQALPRPGARVRVAVAARPAPAASARTPAPTRPPAPTRQGRAYANCDEARAAGVAPIHRGSPDYELNRRLDRDGDGIACE